jgi:hypothetical protein
MRCLNRKVLERLIVRPGLVSSDVRGELGINSCSELNAIIEMNNSDWLSIYFILKEGKID